LAVIAIGVYVIRYALLPFVFAIAIAFVVEPLVLRVQRWTGLRRWVAAALLASGIVLILVGAGYWIGTAAVGDLSQFAKTAPQTLSRFVADFVGRQITLFGHSYTPKQLVQQFGALIGAALGGSSAITLAGRGIGAVLGSVLTVVLIPYMMISGPRLSAGAIWLIPPERRRTVELLLPKIIPALRRYLGGIVLVVLYTTGVAYIGSGLIFNLPQAPLLSLTVGILEMVPVVGPVASGALVALTAFQQNGVTAIILLGAFAIALRLSIDNVIGPVVLGKAGRVHPVVVIFAFICGATLFGVIGLILAVPAAVCLRIVLQHYYAEPIRTREDS
jgi:predicted PurR-regulated permease PerM